MASTVSSAGGSTGTLLKLQQERQLRKTEMCKFFLQGSCGKGTRCAYAHSYSEIREKPDLSCTSMCRDFLRTGNCSNPNCTFAHNERQLRTTSTFYKTKMCRFAASDQCKHGNACRFAHCATELNGEQPKQPGRIAGPGGSPSPAASVSHFSTASGTEESRCTRFADSSLADGFEDTDLSDMNRVPYPPPEDSEASTRAGGSSQGESLGSGESSEEQGLRNSHVGTKRLDKEKRPGESVSSSRHCTTMMLTNVPHFLTQGALVSMLEDLTTSMRGTFDFFYCPWDPFQDCNLGYAIVNFFSRSVAAEFENHWSNKPLFHGQRGAKKLRIVPAALQGRAANIRHFSGFSLAHHEDPRFRPLVRAGPREMLRPMVAVQNVTIARTHEAPDAAASSRASQALPVGIVDPDNWRPYAGAPAMPRPVVMPKNTSASESSGSSGSGNEDAAQMPPPYVQLPLQHLQGSQKVAVDLLSGGTGGEPIDQMAEPEAGSDDS